MHSTTFRPDGRTQQSLERLEALARLMDGAFVLPGTTIRFGLDGIIGLVPVAGDMIGVSSRPISSGKLDSLVHQAG